MRARKDSGKYVIGFEPKTAGSYTAQLYLEGNPLSTPVRRLLSPWFLMLQQSFSVAEPAASFSSGSERTGTIGEPFTIRLKIAGMSAKDAAAPIKDAQVRIVLYCLLLIITGRCCRQGAR